MGPLFDEVNAENFTHYAARHYNNPQCTDIDEFYDDLQRFKYLKKLINRYIESGELSERRLLNHMIVIINLFGIQAGRKMLEYKMEEKHWPVIKPMLIYLSYITEKDYIDVPLDMHVVNTLRKMK